MESSEKFHRIAGFKSVNVIGRGKMLRVYEIDGTTRDVGLTIKSALKKIAAFYALDIAASRSRAKAITGGSQEQPLVFTPGLVLIPVRVKDELSGGNAYFALGAIEEVNCDEGSAAIALTGGHMIATAHNASTLKKRISQAKEVLAAWQQDFNHRTKESGGCPTGTSLLSESQMLDLLHIRIDGIKQEVTYLQKSCER